MNITLDTHTLLWYSTDYSKLSKTAENIIDNAETIFIPTIVLLELYYLLKKRKQVNKFKLILKTVTDDSSYTILALDLVTVLAVYNQKSTLEIHDAIIAASAKLLDVPLVTKDEAIRKVYQKTIW